MYEIIISVKRRTDDGDKACFSKGMNLTPEFIEDGPGTKHIVDWIKEGCKSVDNLIKERKGKK